MYSTAVEVSNGAYYTAHLIFDDQLDITRIGRKVYTHAQTLGEAQRIALRDGVTDLFEEDPPETVVVHESTIGNPALELGRLPHGVRPKVREAQFSFTPHMHNNCQKLLSALAGQDMGAEWYTGSLSGDHPTMPLTVYLDGSHKHADHIEVTEGMGGSTTFGYVIVDAAGRILEVRANQLDDPSESLHAEYLALKYAVDAVNQITPAAEVIFKTDNSNIKHTFQCGNDAPPRFKLIAAYIREALDTFHNARVIETLRDKNLFADALADVAHERCVEYQPVEITVDEDAPEYTYTV